MTPTLKLSKNQKLFSPLDDQEEAILHLSVLLPPNSPPVPNRMEYFRLLENQIHDLARGMSLEQLTRVIEDGLDNPAIYGPDKRELIQVMMQEDGFQEMFARIRLDLQKPTPPLIQAQAKDYLENEMWIEEFLSHLKGLHDLT